MYHSFFGGLQSVAWSPDGKFIVAGSQDDLICLFQFRGRQIASFQGHRSWVFLFNQPTCIAFEEWSCTDKSYKFGSVGDDGHFLMWQFSMGSLGRPKFLVNLSD